MNNTIVVSGMMMIFVIIMMVMKPNENWGVYYSNDALFLIFINISNGKSKLLFYTHVEKL